MKYSLYFFLTFFLWGCESSSDKLPIHGRKSVQAKTLNGENTVDTVYHQIPDFKFVNQDSNFVTPASFRGKIYVADFFFTSCPSICPIMTSQMLRVYEEYKGNKQVSFISHSIDPTYDTVAVLKDYAEKIGVSGDQWHFVTGEMDDIYDIAQLGYMTTAIPGKSQSGDIMHSGAFILIDKDRRVRGMYDGTKKEKVDLLISDMKKLLVE